MKNRRNMAWISRPWWLGLGVAILGAVWLKGAYGIHSTTNYIGLGPEAIVFAVGIGLTICGLILTVQAWLGFFTAAEPEGGGEKAEPEGGAASPSRASLLLAMAGVSAPLLTIRWLGFPLTAMLAFALVARAFNAPRIGYDLAIGAALGSLAWFGFSWLGVSLGAFLPFLG